MAARPGTISRRRMLGLAGAAVGVGAAGLVAGCGSAVAAGVVGASPNPATTTFWNLWGGSDGKRAEAMYDAYRGAHGGPGLLNTYWAVILPAGPQAVAVFVFKRFFDGLPKEIEESARLDGASYWTIYRVLVMPLFQRRIVEGIAGTGLQA